MSLNSGDTKTGHVAEAHGLAAMPRLQPGNYAAWRADADVHLQRTGAKNVHTKPQTAAEWQAQEDLVTRWDDADEAAAMAAYTSASAVPAATAATAAEIAEEKRRDLVRAAVDRSRRAHGAIYSALPV